MRGGNIQYIYIIHDYLRLSLFVRGGRAAPTYTIIYHSSLTRRFSGAGLTPLFVARVLEEQGCRASHCAAAGEQACSPYLKYLCVRRSHTPHLSVCPRTILIPMERPVLLFKIAVDRCPACDKHPNDISVASRAFSAFKV